MSALLTCPNANGEAGRGNNFRNWQNSYNVITSDRFYYSFFFVKSAKKIKYIGVASTQDIDRFILTLITYADNLHW